ncbi:MAG: asparagine synthase C-terminal domain-containing protein [Nitrososphaera sp.]|uniref:asparagine synthase C-terminal domain-containing protein n=1 Tax=Nitrososphaera sp. TaxID=1971748 RepID=UPI003D6E7321
MTSCEELAGRLAASVQRNGADALLLSGGLDSAILATLMRPAYCVTAAFGKDAPDLAFARQVAGKYCTRHTEEVFGEQEMAGMVETVIKVFKTFDPIEIRNSCVALAALQRARADGFAKVATGDGGDELFAGYNYLSRHYGDLQRLEQELQRLWGVMHFSSRTLGRHLGIEVATPFLDGEFAEFAKGMPASEKVGERAGQKWGKFILRTCFERELGELAWRPKMAQEQGAATDRFCNFIEQRIDDGTLANRSKTASSEGVEIRSKEHLNYYAIFRSYFPPPKEESGNCEFACPGCRACARKDGRFCRTCGAFPITPVSL